ncbi:hypothetical protein CK203_025947 [Vitis vinifera]|uniref:Retrotransposon gag domain-containing protein n=1 Tax=Vitis vinifera TaxID=29760 RepID=A0A438IKT1_VITVI|nr:hypothetical protein CK203_025947 [Vitis vinifera]
MECNHHHFAILFRSHMFIKLVKSQVNSHYFITSNTAFLKSSIPWPLLSLHHQSSLWMEEGSFWRLLEPSTLSHWWKSVEERCYKVGIAKEACRALTWRRLASKPVGGRLSLLHGAGGKKDKSRDAVANMEARLAKVELAMADTRKGLDLIDQSMEKGLEDLREQIQDLRESMESRIEALATRMESRDQEVRQELAIYKAAVSARVMATPEASRVEVPKPHRFSGKRDAKELDNFLWHMERYFEAIALTDEAAKVRTVTLYLTDTATLWWRRRFADMEKAFAP